MTELTEAEIFEVLAAVTPAIGKDAALRVRLALGLKKLAKYEAAITELHHNQRLAVQALQASYGDGRWVELPHVTKRKIADLDREIALLIEQAHRIALDFGWGLAGGFDSEGCYRFRPMPMRELFTA